MTICREGLPSASLFPSPANLILNIAPTNSAGSMSIGQNRTTTYLTVGGTSHSHPTESSRGIPLIPHSTVVGAVAFIGTSHCSL
jgi:hypothetical protein